MEIPPPSSSPEKGSQLRQALAERGVIVMKESHVVARIPTESLGPPLEIAGQILVRVRNSQRNVTVGVRFEQSESSHNIAAVAFVDVDEVPELLEALVFINKAAAEMAGQQRDYTEVSYSTRDDMTLGFYHDAAKQRTFARLDTGKRAIILSANALGEIQNAIDQAQTYVSERRKAWEPRS